MSLLFMKKRTKRGFSLDTFKSEVLISSESNDNLFGYCFPKHRDEKNSLKEGSSSRQNIRFRKEFVIRKVFRGQKSGAGKHN